MRILPTKPRFDERLRRRRVRSALARVDAGEQQGFLLVEVIISSLLVGVVVVATLTGFDVVNRTTADERHHTQAAILAAQSQEQLRTDPAGTLAALETSPHGYTRTVGGTTYTITQEAKAINASAASTGCNVTQTTGQTSANVQITSSVTWPQLLAAKRPAVRESSIITPPTGSGLEIDVGNAPAPTAGVAGVTAIVKYTSVLTKSPGTLEATTDAGGCIVFGGIPATSAIVEIPEKLRYVTSSGALKIPNKEVTITPNTTTHDAVTYNEGGRISAEFTYKGQTEWEGLKVKGDTFVAFNVAIPAPPEFMLGSSAFEYEAGGEEHYKPLVGSYATAAFTAAGLKYLSGDLFPFPSPGAWSVYAGDCTKNNPSAIKEVELQSGVYVEAGKTTNVKVPLSHVQMNLYNGTQSSKGSLESTVYPVKITNTECEGAPTPDNAATAPIIEHKQLSSSTGHLENPFLPFGKAKLCVFNAGQKKTYTLNYNNNTVGGSTTNIYISERSEAERTAQRVKAESEEAATKAARIKKEEEPRVKREAEETTKRKEAEKLEAEGKLPAAYSGATEYALGARVSEAGKLYQSLKAANKGHTPKTNATWWKTISRAEVESKRASEEAATAASALKAEEEEKKAGRIAAEAAEKATKTAREANETKEAEDAAKSGVLVESGKASC